MQEPLTTTSPRLLIVLVGQERATIPDVLAARVAKTPDALAVFWQERRWGYADLWWEAERFAGYLAERLKAGLVEDMAQAYPKSQKLVDQEALEVQKDIWHVERDGGRLARTMERAAYKAMSLVYDLEEELLEQGVDEVFYQQYLPAVGKQDRAIEQHTTLTSSGTLTSKMRSNWLTGAVVKSVTARPMVGCLRKPCQLWKR